MSGRRRDWTVLRVERHDDGSETITVNLWLLAGFVLVAGGAVGLIAHVWQWALP